MFVTPFKATANLIAQLGKSGSGRAQSALQRAARAILDIAKSNELINLDTGKKASALSNALMELHAALPRVPIGNFDQELADTTLNPNGWPCTPRPDYLLTDSDFDGFDINSPINFFNKSRFLRQELDFDAAIKSIDVSGFDEGKFSVDLYIGDNPLNPPDGTLKSILDNDGDAIRLYFKFTGDPSQPDTLDIALRDHDDGYEPISAIAGDKEPLFALVKMAEELCCFAAAA
jgi:hypothetical protein